MKEKIRLSLISLMTIAAMLLGKDVFSRCLFTEEDKEQAFCDTNLVSSSVPSAPACDGSELTPENEQENADMHGQSTDHELTMHGQCTDHGLTIRDLARIEDTRVAKESREKREGDRENKSFNQRYLDNSGPLVGEAEPSYLPISDKTTDKKPDECFLTAESTWDEYLEKLTLNSQCRGDPCGRPPSTAHSPM